jgi:hypothetical protein
VNCCFLQSFIISRGLIFQFAIGKAPILRSSGEQLMDDVSLCGGMKHKEYLDGFFYPPFPIVELEGFSFCFVVVVVVCCCLLLLLLLL